MGKLRCPVSSCVFDIVSIWAEECVFCIYSTFASHVFAVFDIVNNWHLCGTCITLSLTHFCSICISLVFPTMYQRQLTLGPAPALDCAALKATADCRVQLPHRDHHPLQYTYTGWFFSYASSSTLYPCE